MKYNMLEVILYLVWNGPVFDYNNFVNEHDDKWRGERVENYGNGNI